MSESHFPYLHGFNKTEQERLHRQARFCEQVLYSDLDFSEQKHILEVGSGVGAQTEILLRRFPEMKITCIEKNKNQIEAANKHLQKMGVDNSRYTIIEADAENLPFESKEFDGAFICWVLEHLPKPDHVLSEMRRVLQPGSTLYVTEVMNSTFFLEPYSTSIWKYWLAFNDYQYANAGDPFIGAKIGNLLLSSGYQDIFTKVKTLHFDNRKPEQRKRAIAFWKELLHSGADQLIKAEVIDAELVSNMSKEFDKAERDPKAVFFYSFMQAKATV